MQYTIPSSKEVSSFFHHKGHIEIFKKVRKSHIIRINGLCLCENKGADQAHSKLLLYIYCTIPSLLQGKFQPSNNLLCLFKMFCVGPGLMAIRQIFSLVITQLIHV